MRLPQFLVSSALLPALLFLSGCVFFWPSTPRPEFTRKTIQGPSSFEGTYSNNPKTSLHTFIAPFGWMAPSLSYIMRVGRGINEDIEMLRLEIAEPTGWLQVTFLDAQGNELGTERRYASIQGRTWVLRDHGGPFREAKWFVAASGRKRDRAELYLGMTGNMIAYTGRYEASMNFVAYPVPIFLIQAQAYKSVYKRVD